MSDKHNLREYQFAKDVVKDFPEIIKELENLRKVLYGKQSYACVSHVVSAIEDSLVMAKRQLIHYQVVYQKKGKE